MELIFELLWWPIVGILEAVAGVLWPSDNPRVRRLPRLCLILLICGLAFTICAVLLAYFAPGWFILPCLGVATILLIVSGAVGNRVERICKTDTSRKGSMR